MAGRASASGQETYTHICAACHGADGRGEAANLVPRIAGQHYPYLRLQIDVAAALHRDLAPPEMTSALRSMGSPQKTRSPITCRVSAIRRSCSIPVLIMVMDRKNKAHLGAVTFFTALADAR